VRINRVFLALLVPLVVVVQFAGYHSAALPLSPQRLQLLYGAAEVVMVLNCIFDLALTWGFYNPIFQRAHDLLVSEKFEGAGSSASSTA
jgi:hypothetical protein